MVMVGYIYCCIAGLEYVSNLLVPPSSRPYRESSPLYDAGVLTSVACVECAGEGGARARARALGPFRSNIICLAKLG